MRLSYKRDELLVLLHEAKARQKERSAEEWKLYENDSRGNFEQMLFEAKKTGKRPGMPWTEFPMTAEPFDTIIAAVEASSDDQIELTPSEFATYVLGERDSRVPFDLF